MGKDREPNIIEKLKGETQRKECTIGEYILSDADEVIEIGGQSIKAIKVIDKKGNSVSVGIDPSAEPHSKRFDVLTSDGGRFPCELDQDGNPSPASHDGKTAPSLICDDVLCEAVRKLRPEKG